MSYQKSVVFLLEIIKRLMRCFRIIVLLFLSVVPCSGKNIVRDGIRYKITSDTTVSVAEYKNKSNASKKSVVIPSYITIRGIRYSVTSIEPLAFCGCHFIESLELPSTLETIREKTVILCSSLSTITIPSGVSDIADGAIYGNAMLNEIIVDTLNRFFDSRFDCNAIIRKKDNTLVTGCNNTTIPESVTCIADGAFHDCSGLGYVCIPSGVEVIGDNAFEGCNNLKTVIFSNGIRKIGFSSFENCIGIESISIPDGILEIGGRAFHGCSSLINVTIPKSVEYIGDEVFSGCSSLSSVYIDPDNKAYSSYGLSNIIVDSAEKRLLQGCATSILPDDIEEIGTGAFVSCHKLEYIRLPDNVRYILDDAFHNCTGLTGIHIPNSIRDLNSCAFMNCSRLGFIDLPDNLERIWVDAFNGCKSLKEISIPDKVWCIDSRAFMNCENLEYISIPESVTAIYDYSFWGCNNLSSISILCSIPPGISKHTFSSYGTLHVKKGLLKVYKKHKYWRNFSIVDDL